MWRKLARLAFVEAVLVALLFVSIPTHAVRYDTAEATGGREVEIFWQGLLALGLIGVLIALVVIPWLAYRMVRKKKRSDYSELNSN
jgi:hypothetical protein